MRSDQVSHGIMHLKSVSYKGGLLDHVTESRWLVLRVTWIISWAPGHENIPVYAATPSADRAKHCLPLKGGKGMSALLAYNSSSSRQVRKLGLVRMYRLRSL